MIFRSILNAKTANLQPEFDKLINAAFRNQTHPGDLLLILVNGFYNEEAHTWDNLEKPLSPYMFGPNWEGHSERLHHEFVGEHLKREILDQDPDEYKALHEWSIERNDEIRALEKKEAYSVQHEMQLYNKIWEMDLFIKKLYQLTRLVLGQEYDWHFSIALSNRAKNATGTREKIIREKVRDALEKDFPLLYSTMKNGYKSQLRNAIAHSTYSIYGRYIHLNNDIAEDPANQIKVISFDEWIDIFHDTLVFYSQTTRLVEMIDRYYNLVAENNGHIMKLRISRLHPAPTVEYHIVKHRPGINDWYWKANDPEGE